MYFNILQQLSTKEIKIDTMYQQKFLQFIFENQVIAEEYIEDIEDYIANVLVETDWFNSFVIDLFYKYPCIYKSIYLLFIPYLHMNDKHNFIYFLKIIKCSDFFKQYFDHFNYTVEEKKEISKLFSFSVTTIPFKNIDYGIKRDIFDIFGIIPSLLSCHDLLDIEQRDFKFLINNFKQLNIQEKLNVIIYTFYYSFPENKYKKTKLKFYKHFYKQLEKENDEVLDFLSKKNKNTIEQEFLDIIIPIKEEFIIKRNIINF